MGALGKRLLRPFLLVAGAFAGFLLWNLLTADAVTAATPEPGSVELVDVDLDIGAPTPGAPILEALPPLNGVIEVNLAAIPPLAGIEPIRIEVGSAPPPVEPPDRLRPLGREPGAPVVPPPLSTTEPETPAPSGTSHARDTDEAKPTHLNRVIGRSAATQRLSRSLDQPSTLGAVPAPTPDSDGVPMHPLPLLAVLGAAISLAVSKSRDWSWLVRAPRSALLAPALERPG